MNPLNLPQRIINTVIFVSSKYCYLTKNFLLKNKIKKKQKSLLREYYNPYSENVILFLTPAYDIVNGGVMSISSIYEETGKLKKMHGAETILCTVPKDPLLLNYTKFKNKNYIYEFSEVLSYFKNIKSMMIHIPEYICGRFLDNLPEKDWRLLDKIEDLHLNIMIQNIEYALKDLDDIQNLSKRFVKVTGTLAHKKYSNQEMREKFGFPLHKLSVYISPEQYNKKSYKEKEDILIVSPDEHPLKPQILKLISKNFTQINIQIIHGLKYEDYKEIISRAKWALTFGEGLDGYFIEPIFSGSISFSVYNPKFFTEDFKHLKTVYSDYEELIKKMSLTLMNLNHEKEYNEYQREEYELCTNYYDYGEYVKNLELFYKGNYTYK